MDDSTNGQSQDARPARGRYERPAIEESASFERLKLACGHHGGDPEPECNGVGGHEDS